jgi:hypothetical protein
MGAHIQNNLSQDEKAALAEVRKQGRVRVQLHQKGIFSEQDFVLYGVLERLVIRKEIVALGREGDQMNAAFSYALAVNAAHPRAPGACAMDRNAA